MRLYAGLEMNKVSPVGGADLALGRRSISEKGSPKKMFTPSNNYSHCVKWSLKLPQCNSLSTCNTRRRVLDPTQGRKHVFKELPAPELPAPTCSASKILSAVYPFTKSFLVGNSEPRLPQCHWRPAMQSWTKDVHKQLPDRRCRLSFLLLLAAPHSG